METVIVDLYNVRELLRDRLICISPVYEKGRERFFWINKDIHVQLQNGRILHIPTTYQTDLSSSPKWLWSFAAPYGHFLLAAIIHDYLYSTNTGTRRQADVEMLLWSIAINENHSDNFIRYRAVRWFGSSWWKKAGQRISRERLANLEEAIS